MVTMSRADHTHSQVLLLEQQLADKTHSAQSHVEELTHLRTELAKERASLGMQREEELERAAVELGRVKALHAEQCRELQAQVERVKGEKLEREKEAAQLRGALKGRFFKTVWYDLRHATSYNYE